MMVTSAKALCIGCSTAILLVTGAAKAQEACTSYVVVDGDHLRGIARAAYGDPDLYRVIFEANREIIGNKADLILTGTTLALPCKPGSSETATVTAVVDPASEPLSTEVVDQASVALSTDVIDPAKEPLVILPEIPVEDADNPTTAEAEVAEAAPTEAEPAPEPAPEPAAEPVTTAPAEAPAEESAVVAAEPVEEAVVVAPEPVAEPVAEPAPEPVEDALVEEAVVVAEEPAPEPVAEPVEEAPTETEVAADPAPAPVQPVTPDDEGPIRMVTGNGYSPFADEMLAGGGMFTQIVEMAVFRADPNLPYSLTFINDWQAHIDALLPSQAYDLSFPWVRPNCEAPGTLSTADLARCADFVFSAPYYEIVDGFFAAADSDLLISTEYADFLGKRICRPEAFTTGVLEAQGLNPDTVTMSRPQQADDCFDALAAGEVDLVSIDTAVGDSVLRHRGLAEEFRQNPNLTSISTLHVVAHKSNARAIAMLGALDAGLMEMNQSGEWWDIISDALDKE